MAKENTRELESICHFNQNKIASLTLVNPGQLAVDWDFQCSKATIDKSRDEGYDVKCNFTRNTCPIYLEMLRQAEEMTDEEYQKLKE